MRLRKESEADAELHGVNTGVGRYEASIRNMHKAQFRAEIVFAAQKMQADRTTGSEVYVGSADGCLDVGE